MYFTLNERYLQSVVDEGIEKTSNPLKTFVGR
jgi:hypothetical protein